MTETKRRFLEECSVVTIAPNWLAFERPARWPIGDSEFVPVEPLEVSGLVYAHSLTQTPKCDGLGTAEIEVACLVRPPRMAAENAKVRTRVATYAAIKRGAIKRAPCEVCGDETAEAHHDDYSDPLNVRWLCRTHHDDLHHPERLAA